MLHQVRSPLWMATYGGETVAMGRMFGLDAAIEALPDPDRGMRNIWGATILFGPIVFPLFGSTIPELLEGVTMRTPGCHQLWPYAGSFTWAPRPAFDDHQLVGFADGPLNELLRHQQRLAKA